jgi:Transcriptional regulator
MAKKESKTSKEEIKLKAFKLMASQGVKNISMRQIADACGVSKPVLYYYFKDKDDLLFQMIKERMEEINTILKDGIKKDLSFAALLRTLLFSHYIVKTDFRETSSFLLNLSVYVKGNSGLEQKLIKMRKQANKIIYEILNLQCQKGRLNKKNIDTGYYLVLAVMSLLTMCGVDKSIKINKEIINDMTCAILKGVSYKGEVK